MSFSFFSRPHPLVPPVSTFRIQQGYDEHGNYESPSMAWGSTNEQTKFWRPEGDALSSPNVLQRRNLDLSALPISQAAAEGSYGLLQAEDSRNQQALCLSWVSQDAEKLSMANKVEKYGERGPEVMVREVMGWKAERNKDDRAVNNFSGDTYDGSFSQAEGDLEIIAQAGSMKQILSLPYSDDQVSLAVHRVGETLFIDSVGRMSKHSAEEGTPGPPDASDQNSWKKPKKSCSKRAKQNRNLQRALYNRVLSASETERLDSVKMTEKLVWEDEEPECPGSTSARKRQVPSRRSESLEQQQEENINQEWQGPLAISVYERGDGKETNSFRDAKEEEGEEKGEQHSRTPAHDVNASKVHLKVEESDSSEEEEEQEESILRMCRLRFGGMQMLLGSDVMVFGSSGHPCVSLYVRDPEVMSLHSYLDLWLDNVIASVPEVMICWHKDCVMQGYMLKRTQDIPEMTHFAFSPERVEKNGAQVLKWLRQECSREASTYWLYREQGDDKLQLYNLEAMNRAMGASKDESFSHIKSVPPRFAFPVAMLCFRAAARLAGSLKQEHRTRRRELLLHCSSLLDEREHGFLIATVEEGIAETYVAIDIEDDMKDDKEISSKVRSRRLGCVESYHALHADTFVLPSSDKRFDTQCAVGHLSRGINVLQTLAGGGSLLYRLKRKALECFVFLCNVHVSKGQFDSAFLMLRRAFQCAITSSKDSQLKPLEAFFLARLRVLLGDLFASPNSGSPGDTSSNDGEEEKESDQAPEQDVEEISNNLESGGQLIGLDVHGEHLPYIPLQDVVAMPKSTRLQHALRHYEKATSYFAFHGSYVDFVIHMRRLGHARNEMAKIFWSEMNVDEAETNWKQALSVFTTVGDEDNQAVVAINLGRLMRGRSSMLRQEGGGRFQGPARACFASSIPMYELAFKALKTRQTNPMVWKIIQGEIAETLDEMASLLEKDILREDPSGNAAAQWWSDQGAREDAQLIVDLRARALDFLQQQQAPALRVARSHLSLGSFYLKTLDLGQGELGSSPASRVHKSRFEAAENQLRKCMHICGSEAEGGEALFLLAVSSLSKLVRRRFSNPRSLQAMKESLDALAIARRLPSGSQQLTNDIKSARENVLDDLRSLLRDLSTTAPARGGASSHRNKDAFKDLYRKALKLQVAGWTDVLAAVAEASSLLSEVK
uniref:Erythroid differentiation-related factor 1 n=1 Tax=Guillardia theta TaxID=55529 RepID=A0A7S4NLS9_GUITH|mmetsp:Transcript_25657/g.84729  ORF Transcript_25657/g.84729 Transcript_25657/m.84729 type:complete len:1175 (+) Transcript_25657:60-3584(+)